MGRVRKLYQSIPEHSKELKFVEESKLDLDRNVIKHLSNLIGKYHLSFSLGVVSAGIESGNIKPTQTSVFRKIDALIKKLESNQAITDVRPETIRDAYLPEQLETLPHEKKASTHGTSFVFERTVATKLIFPPLVVEQVPSLRSFAVWVSEPPSIDLAVQAQKTDIFDFKQTFLYLIEARWNLNEPYHGTFSGTSALKFIMNFRNGIDRIDTNWEPEKFGRGSELDPIEKLKSQGAIVSEPQLIETIYRKRYITDEQCVSRNGSKVRVCDLIGYPIYIATCLT